jgi:hypothetical protein
VAAADDLSADQIASLATAAAHPHDPLAAAGVRWIQTHISHVFLTPGFVYKLRKSVNPAFLDFTGRAERNADCLREVALNRRFSPDVYLGVAPVRLRGARAEIGPVGETLSGACEHVVVMRRLPDGGDAPSLLERGALPATLIDAVAERIAAFHAAHGLGVPAPFSAEAWRERVAAPMRANVAGLVEAARAGVVAADAAARFAEETQRALLAARERLEQRRCEGRVVDGHGDLHLQHVWLDEAPEPAPAPPRAAPAGLPRIALIDCLEFSDDLRRIDAASEVAFLAMDLRYRGARSLAERFLRRYAALRDDFGLYGVVELFSAHRAGVRAQVAAIAAQDTAISAAQRSRAAESAERHLAFALELLRPAALAPLVLVCGSVGTGKSTLAERLADACGGAVISSDRTRKALAGLAPTQRGDAGLYADAFSERVYAGLLERAEPVLASGRPALLDATFARTSQREAARAFAERSGVRALLVEARCAEGVARERVAARALRGGDPSDAGPELVAVSRERFEATTEWPPQRRFEVATDRPGWEADLATLLEAIRPA